MRVAVSPNEDQHSVSREPHLRRERAEPDASEEKVRGTLAREAARTRNGDRRGESVYDELDVLPGRGQEALEQDWSCSACGYNLRGLEAGHPCPECGHRELYRPPPPGADSYQAWLRRRVAETSERTGWALAVAAVLLGGLWAVVASLIGTHQSATGGAGMLILLVVFVPAVEETMKISAAACVIEVRPYLFRRVEQLQLATIGSAAVFAVLENVVYLNLYHPNHTFEFALFRWTVCPALHVGCTAVACRGLIGPWQQALNELRQPRITQGVPMLVAAILIHATYNASVLVYEVYVAPLR